MSLPANVSDAEFSRVIHDIVQRLGGQFGGLHGGKDDFAQEVALWSLEALPKYDSSRPLGAFLYTNAKNRALNAVRDKVKRSDYPCKDCHEGRPCGPDGGFCTRYAEWSARNQRKRNLSRTVSIEKLTEGSTGSSTVEDEAIGRELESKIEDCLPPKLRADLRKMRDGDGKSVSYARRASIQKHVAAILGDPSLVTLKDSTNANKKRALQKQREAAVMGGPGTAPTQPQPPEAT